MNIGEKINSSLHPDAALLTRKLVLLARQHVKEVVLVGGVVRDLIIGRPIQDVDFMLEHPADAIIQELGKNLGAKVVSHQKFMTFTLKLASGSHFDIVTAREEEYRTPAQLPDVRPTTIECDLKRRDFTINAIAARLSENRFGELLDPFNGLVDITEKLVRVIHPKSFIDDPTRIYRAARFAARLGFKVEMDTEALILESIQKKTPALLSPVRLKNEIQAILMEADPLRSLRLLDWWGGLKFIDDAWTVMPEHLSAFHSTRPGASRPSLPERWAAWLNPWGKEKGRKSMDALGMEKELKKDVLNLL